MLVKNVIFSLVMYSIAESSYVFMVSSILSAIIFPK